jgi:c-di-GMP-binding flagellar brake protein YcgR
MDNERRNEARFSLSRMVAYDMASDRYLRARGVDISRSGMSFASEEYVDPGLRVWLSFSIPEPDGSWRRLEAEGVVSSVSDAPKGCRFAVAIARMEPEERMDFEAFIDRLQAEAAAPEGELPAEPRAGSARNQERP